MTRIASSYADVCELRGVDEVADREHAGLAGAAVLVDLDEAAVGDLDRRCPRARAGPRYGRRPTDTTTASTSRFSPSPKWTTVPPLPFGVWPITLTPVLMSMFFFLKLRTTTLARSLSSPGRIFGRPSRIVTCAPRSANVLANSHPIAPPPMTAIRSGTWSSISTSSLVMIGPPTIRSRGSSAVRIRRRGSRSSRRSSTWTRRLR